MARRRYHVASFEECVDFANKDEHIAFFAEQYRQHYPNHAITIERVEGPSILQRQGIDAIVTLENGRRITFEEKKRTKLWGPNEENPDILLEECSVYRGNLEDCATWKQYSYNKIGWSLDPDKRSDFLAYAIVPIKRVYFFPFETLRLVFEKNLPKWRAIYDPDYRILGHTPISKRNPYYEYVTLNVPVPRKVLNKAIADAQNRPFRKSDLIDEMEPPNG